MPYRICKQIVIESGHMLSKHPENCRFPHGHTRRVEFVLEAEDLDINDMVCDFKVITETMHAFIQSFDHAMCMNTDDPQFEHFKEIYGDRIIAFDGVDPTTEVLAKTIFDDCRARLTLYKARTDKPYPLGDAVRLHSVRVWETPTSWAEYSET